MSLSLAASNRAAVAFDSASSCRSLMISASLLPSLTATSVSIDTAEAGLTVAVGMKELSVPDVETFQKSSSRFVRFGRRNGIGV